MRYIFFFSLLFLLACGKNEFDFEFNLDSSITDNYNVNYYATDSKGGVTIQAVASVRDGKCLLKGVTKLPTLVYITERKSNYPLVMYAEKGNKISISGKTGDPLEWNVGGNQINEELSIWREKNIKALSKNITDSVNAAVKFYVEENKNNPVSTILMLCYYDRKTDEQGYINLMSSLEGNARDAEWINIAGRADQMFHQYRFPAKVKSMLFRTEDGKGDTIASDGKNPMFLFFWQTGNQDKIMIVDSIKKLKKEIPDSVIIFADLCLDADSTGWKNAIRRDSIDYVKRFWVPTGLADSTIMKLKVNSLPYFIVVNKDGEQVYRGKELPDAINEYRSLIKKKKDKKD